MVDAGQALVCAEWVRPVTAAAVQAFGPRAPVATLLAQLRAESNCDTRAQSYAGAQGMAQFTRGTAALMATKYPNLRPALPFDPSWAIRAQATLMADLFGKHGGFDYCERMAKATASYNQGERWTFRAEAMSGTPEFWFGGVEYINPGKSLANYEQTLEYVRKILLRFEPIYVTGLRVRGACS